MKNAQLISELKTKSRRIDIAADLAAYMHANMFNDELRKMYHEGKISLYDWLSENVEEGLAYLGGDGLIERIEYDMILENADCILDDILERSEDFLISEIEYAEESED